MEFSRSFHISADYKDRGGTPTWDSLQFAEVIFIDKTNPESRPLIYQLNDQKISIESLINAFNAPVFSRDSFILIGEALYIDKKKKQVSLTNKNIIAYNHLVIASGKKTVLSFQDDELVAALQTLTDALRVKPKIPGSFPLLFKNFTHRAPHKNETRYAISEKPESESHVEKFVHPYILSGGSQFNPVSLQSLKRLYEIQI